MGLLIRMSIETQSFFSAAELKKFEDGKVTADELGKVMNTFGLSPSKEDLDDLINEFDINGDKMIDIREFNDAMAHQMKGVDTDAELRAVFKIFDTNSDSLIDMSELKRLLASIGENLSDNEIIAMMKEADLDGDKCVNFEEFQKLMKTASSL